MTLYNFAVFVNHELHTVGLVGGPAEPAAGFAPARFLCCLQGRFGIGMSNLSAGINGLLYGFSRQPGRAAIPRHPDIVRNFSNRRSNKNGVIHGPKFIPHLCNNAADTVEMPGQAGHDDYAKPYN